MRKAPDWVDDDAIPRPRLDAWYEGHVEVGIDLSRDGKYWLSLDFHCPAGQLTHDAESQTASGWIPFDDPSEVRRLIDELQQTVERIENLNADRVRTPQEHDAGRAHDR
ncbi:hypothetical protein Pth03_43870 [Planotetraspora thailandica]|uniref:Uncharacterized protein n=1 Tax=Planotetraspora thailandica TaxID=487172 RepID=A0A8J3XZ29_9ACTN|nr:hypothetical protein [Planotetraspora thailandica]GII55998.1 hypothetical protein Pth03_43870 [Planotetraspora thailandica]